ncbi:carbohydate-binding domain-containing protein [Xenorhabdus bovienii]|uniref:beta-N-acetylhexosaminidase n=1 Tax=Xenorhabdus bovienii TaxID=40576 RepID=UPI00237CF1F2|nr:beta-N-acetylhexosaminidase [Xenorhabdus bovienii]MDE1485473.1 carbohydate-binding domain-containing protein [Xenorhabdus bovienii]MDE9476382.1 carbohydate-binding domain-containing protein [Xenorhabdus bovienii]MDE9531121.1 carbohydate-binding domain-containing protein [Xenorhabdus bovienii]
MKSVKLRTLAALITTVGLMGCVHAEMTSQQVVDSLSQLKVNFKIKDNQAGAHGTDCAILGADGASCNQVHITLANGNQAIDSSDWAIYFHSIRQILKVDHEQYKITHITGDLHKLEPTEKFTGIKANEKILLPIFGEYWQIYSTDFMPRWYATSGDAMPKILANTDTEDLSAFLSDFTGDQWKRTTSDNNIQMTPETRFVKNQQMVKISEDQLRGQVIPTPKTLTIHSQDVNLSRGVKLELGGLSNASIDVIRERFASHNIKLTDNGYRIAAQINANKFTGNWRVQGAYSLNITTQGTQIVAFDQSGVFYGLQSLLSLLPANGAPTIATLTAKDAPRFEYRGIFLDVGRNFHSKEAVLRLLDQMSSYKLNKFHFHLSDDEGWRLEIPGLPELTEVGSKRCHDLSETQCLLPQLGSGPDSNNMGSGYFSRQDYIDILKYAKARQIEVIPEIDIPAHARAAVVSMEARYKNLMAQGKEQEANEYRLLDPTDTTNTTSVQLYDRRSYLNPCMDSSKRFVDKIISEIALMHKEAELPLKTWHFGGDEAKNIRLGAGYQDKDGPIEPGKGIINKKIEDKPWAKSQACQKMIAQGIVKDVSELDSHFAIEVSKIVNTHGIDTMQAWQDGLKHVKSAKDFATKHVAVNFWDTLYWGGYDSANDWANKGYRVVVSSPDYVYLDMPYEVSPKERGYYWATRFNDEAKIFSFAPNNMPQNAETSVDRDGNHFNTQSNKHWPGAYGLSGQSWSETVRTDDQMEYMIYPRLLPLAERAWHQASWEQNYQQGREYKGGVTHYVDTNALNNDWIDFANLMGQHELAKLDKANIAYRLPVPGGRIVSGTLEANIALPGLAIQYSLDGGKTWEIYDDRQRPHVSSNVKVRSVSTDGKRFSRDEEVKITL